MKKCFIIMSLIFFPLVCKSDNAERLINDKTPCFFESLEEEFKSKYLLLSYKINKLEKDYSKEESQQIADENYALRNRILNHRECSHHFLHMIDMRRIMLKQSLRENQDEKFDYQGFLVESNVRNYEEMIHRLDTLSARQIEMSQAHASE